MGSGTEVARNAGRMVLSDDNFATIVFAIEQGRKIYDNLSKYIKFVLILLLVFVLTFLGAAVFDIAGGSPFSPAQELWIHFAVNTALRFRARLRRGHPGTDGTPATATATRRIRADHERADHGDLRQQADEPGAAGRVRARGARHPDGRIPTPAGHGSNHVAAVRMGARTGGRAVGAMGTRQAHRATVVHS